MAGNGEVVKPPTDIAAALNRSLPYAVRWLNSLELVEEKITVFDFYYRLCDGLVLCAICELYLQEGEFLAKVNRRPIAKRAMLSNLEVALRYIWLKGVRAGHMCSSMDFYLANSVRVLPCFIEMMEVWRFRDCRKKAPAMLKDMETLLHPVGRSFINNPLRRTKDTANTVLNGDFFDLKLFEELYKLKYLTEDFVDGTRLAVILFIGDLIELEELAEYYGIPSTRSEFETNIKLLVQHFQKPRIQIPILLATPYDWAQPPVPSPETLLLQILEFHKVATPIALSKRKFIPSDFKFRDGKTVGLTLEDRKKQRRLTGDPAELEKIGEKSKSPEPVDPLHKFSSDPNEMDYNDNNSPGSPKHKKMSKATQKKNEFHDIIAFLGDRCRMDEFREAFSLPLIRRRLNEDFDLSVAEVMDISRECQIKDDTEVDIHKLIEMIGEYLKDKAGRVAKAAAEIRADVQRSDEELMLLYLEDLRRHYDTGYKLPFTKRMKAKDFEKRIRSHDIIPTVKVEQVKVEWDSTGQVRHNCVLTTKTAAVNGEYRYLFVIMHGESILLQCDVTDLQIEPRKQEIRLVNRYEVLNEESTDNVNIKEEIEDLINFTVPTGNKGILEAFMEEVRIIAHFIPMLEPTETRKS